MTYLQDLVESLNEIGSKPLTKNEAAIINVLLDMTLVLREITNRLEKPKPAPAPAQSKDGISVPTRLISRLVAVIVTENARHEDLACVTESLDWLIENERPGPWLKDRVWVLMDKRRTERENKP